MVLFFSDIVHHQMLFSLRMLAFLKVSTYSRILTMMSLKTYIGKTTESGLDSKYLNRELSLRPNFMFLRKFALLYTSVFRFFLSAVLN